jgi:hypothetical protein
VTFQAAKRRSAAIGECVHKSFVIDRGLDHEDMHSLNGEYMSHSSM